MTMYNPAHVIAYALMDLKLLKLKREHSEEFAEAQHCYTRETETGNLGVVLGRPNPGTRSSSAIDAVIDAAAHLLKVKESK